MLVDIAGAGIAPDRATALAVRLAHIVERHRWPSGLIPVHEGAERDHVDIMVDYGIALCRLAERTGDATWRERGVAGWAEMWRTHGTPHGLALGVGIDGSIRDLRIIVKYQFLAVKSLLAAASTHLLDDAALGRLIRDR